MILNLLVQFTVLFFLASLLVLVFHLILLLSWRYFACFTCFFFSVCRIAIAHFCSYFIFTLYLFNFCFAVPLYFVSNHMPSLRLSWRKAIDSRKLFVRKIKACKGRDFTSFLEPFAYSAWILYYHQCMWFLAPNATITIFATVWAVACVRRDPETFSRDLRIVTRSVHDFKNNCNLFQT